MWDPKEMTIGGVKITDPLYLAIAGAVFLAATVLCFPFMFSSSTRLPFLVIMLLSYVAAAGVGVFWYIKMKKDQGGGTGGNKNPPNQVSNIHATFQS